MRHDLLKIISLGGFGDVTQNMYVYHYLPVGEEKNDQLLIVDVGVGFPEEDIFGVDMIIPDFSYVMKRKEKIVGVLLTHGHEDHIGALPLFISQLGRPIKVYGPKLAVELAKEKLEEFKVMAKIEVIKSSDLLRLGVFKIESVRVTHSIPDTYHYFITTPVGNFYHASDFKFDFTPPDKRPSQLRKIAKFGRRGILAILSDCLGAEKEGYAPSESELAVMFEQKIRTAKGRVFVTAISSNIYRWQEAINASKKVGRKICLVGMSVEKNIKLAKKMGYLKLDESDLIKPAKIKNLPENKVTILIGGSLGQEGSSLDKVVFGKHLIKIKKGDRIIFSSPDYIPGTTKAIYDLIDDLIKMGVDVVYWEIENNLHVSGHAAKQELALLLELTKPKFVIPIGGNYRHIKQFSDLVDKVGFSPESFVFPAEDDILIFNRSGLTKTKEKLALRKVLVDGLGVGDVGEIVLRDRKVLAEEGMIVVVLIYDQKRKSLATVPQVMSRGFVYVKENEATMRKISQIAQDVFNDNMRLGMSFDFARKRIQGEIETYVLEKTARQPMILPVIITV